MTDSPALTTETLIQELRSLITNARSRVAYTVNSELVSVYWQIGKRLREEILNEARAAYGEEVFIAVANTLTSEFGRGFGARNLRHMARFAERFPDPKIVNALRSQLSWTHFRELIAIEDPLKRQFHTELCRVVAPF